MTKENDVPMQPDSKKAAEAMQDAIDKTIEQKKHEPIGDSEAERKVAEDLKQAAERDTKTDAKP